MRGGSGIFGVVSWSRNEKIRLVYLIEQGRKREEGRGEGKSSICQAGGTLGGVKASPAEKESLKGLAEFKRARFFVT